MTNFDVGAVLRPPRLIVVAMFMGVLVFVGIAVFLVGTGQMRADPQLGTVLLPVLALTVFSMIPVHIMVRRAMIGSARRQPPNGPLDTAALTHLAGRFVQLTIIGAAQAEGVSLFGTVVYLVTGVAWALVVPGLGLLFLMTVFPTRSRFGAFVSDATGQPWEDPSVR